MSTWAFTAFSEPEFHFYFQFFLSVDLNKVPKRYLNALTLNLSCMWAWSIPIKLGLLGQFMCFILCQEVRTQ